MIPKYLTTSWEALRNGALQALSIGRACKAPFGLAPSYWAGGQDLQQKVEESEVGKKRSRRLHCAKAFVTMWQE